MSDNTISINRAPVLTLWGVVVMERLGYDHDEALTLGKAMACLNAQAKGRSLGVFGPPKAHEPDGKPKKRGLCEEFWVDVCGRPVPCKHTEAGTRAVVKDKPIDAASVEKYLQTKLGEDLPCVQAAFTELAAAYAPEQLAEVAYHLYERFRPQIASGQKGWGQKGDLDLGLVRSLAEKA